MLNEIGFNNLDDNEYLEKLFDGALHVKHTVSSNLFLHSLYFALVILSGLL